MPEQRLPWRQSLKMLRSRGVRLPVGRYAPKDPTEIDTPDLGKPHRGLRFHDAVYEEIDFENLSLRRTLIERCRFHGVSFRNTDLGQSCLAAEFIDCDFSDAVLICANLAGSAFFACRFRNAALIGSELRGATLEHCDFTDADLTGARLDRVLKESLPLSDTQRRLMVDWRSPDDEGPDEPNPDE
jgi:hypothetical protein